MKNIRIFLIIFSFLIINTKFIYPQAGQLDTTFGEGGIVIAHPDVSKRDSYAESIAIQNDNKIVVAGTSYNGNQNVFSLVRYNPDGSLDNTFNITGTVNTNIRSNGDEARSVALQDDGKIILAGISNNENGSDFALVRYNTDGSLDNTFGTGGKVITSFGDSTFTYANSVAVQKDGKILTAGRSPTSFGLNLSTYSFTIIRYNSDGTLDSDFGTNGIVVKRFGASESEVTSLKIQEDGKIVAGGFESGLSIEGEVKSFVIARLNPDGKLDTTFSDDGVVLTSVGNIKGQTFNYSISAINSISIQDNGKIIACGYCTNDVSGGGMAQDFALVRYNIEGSIDSTFGTDGIKITSIDNGDDIAFSVKIQDDGKIIAAGSYFNSNSGNDFDFVLVRYNSNGSLDGTFGNNGIKTTRIENLYDICFAEEIQSDGKIILAGYSQDSNFNSKYTVVRYNTDGGLDNTFGTEGIVYTKVEELIYQINSAALQNIGEEEKIITVGTIWNENRYNFDISCYHSDGSLDNLFGTNGNVITPVGDINDFPRSVAIQSDGKIISAGYSTVGDNDDFIAIRYNLDGGLDSTFANDGIAIIPVTSSDDYAYSVVIQSDGKIILAGYSSNGNNYGFSAVRCNPDGSIDNTYGMDGKVIIPIGNFNVFGYAAALQSDDKLVIAGYYVVGNKDNFSVVRCNTNGKLDSTFGTDGIVTTPIDSSDSYANSLALQTDGKMIIAGTVLSNGTYDFAVVRYNSDGSLDSTFGKNGIVITPTSNSDEGINSIRVQDDGKIIAAGYSGHSEEYSDFAIIRYNSDGSVDSTFGNNGIPVNNYGAAKSFINSIVIQKDGNIIAAGYVESENANVTTGTLARYIGKNSTTVSVENSLKEIPSSFNLLQNYPNPFNPSTTLSFVIGHSSFVSLKVYDLLGREVATLINEEKPAGNYKVTFDASNLPAGRQGLASGIYFYRLKTDNYISVKKMILLR